jgi:predicted transcriptional regulator
MKSFVQLNNFDTARPTVLKYLQILTGCGLLKQKQEGREIYHYIHDYPEQKATR